MREILFKAKRLDIGEWVEGYYAFASEILCKDNVHVIFTGDGFNWWYEIDPQTVCQYTGMTDKNGKKIFEGDKVKIKYIYLHESKETETDVIWSNNRCSFSPFNWEYECDGCDCYYEIEEVEVVGNIYDKED